MLQLFHDDFTTTVPKRWFQALVPLPAGSSRFSAIMPEPWRDRSMKPSSMGFPRCNELIYKQLKTWTWFEIWYVVTIYIYIVTYVELRWYKPSLKSLFEYVFKQIKLFLFNKCEKTMHRTGLFFSLFYKPSISGFRSKFDLAQRIIPRKMLFVFNTCVFGSSNIP